MQINPKNKLRSGKQLKNETVKGGGNEKDGGKEKDEGIEKGADGSYCIA